MLLGVLGSKLKIALNMDFTVYPFVDLTNRHTVALNGATLQTGTALFVNPSSSDNNHLVLDANRGDFALQRDFDLSFKFKVINANFPFENVVCFGVSDFVDTAAKGVLGFTYTTDGAMNLSHTVGGYQLSLATTIMVSTGVEAAYLLQKRGAVYTHFINGVSAGTATIVTALPDIKTRVMFLGRSAFAGTFGGYQGTLDDLKLEYL